MKCMRRLTIWYTHYQSILVVNHLKIHEENSSYYADNTFSVINNVTYMTISKFVIVIVIASQFAQLIVHSALSMLHYPNQIMRYCLFVGEIGICVLYAYCNANDSARSFLLCTITYGTNK